MEKIMYVDGMMCNHCKATVEKALTALEGVTCAEVSLEEKKVTIRADREIADEILKNAVEAKGFTPMRVI